MKRVQFAGGGRMASAIIEGLLGKSPGSFEVSVSDPNLDAREGLLRLLPDDRIFPTSESFRSGILLIAVKPQAINEVFSELSGRDFSTVISIVAGIPSSTLREKFSRSRIVRAMPNTPALVGRGITALAGDDSEALAEAEAIFGAVGETVRVTEDLMDAVTAISGSGPAYFFLLMRELEAAARSFGIDALTARQLVAATARGAGELAFRSAGTFDDLVAGVASKGGTTEQAIRVFRERGIDEIVMAAADAARQRSKELSK